MSHELTRWEAADNYRGEDLSDYFVVLTKTRDGGAMENSNFEQARKRLGDLEGVRIDRFNHWAVGWLKQILVKEGSEEALLEAEEIMAELNQYPVLDEEDYLERREEVR